MLKKIVSSDDSSYTAAPWAPEHLYPPSMLTYKVPFFFVKSTLGRLGRSLHTSLPKIRLHAAEDSSAIAEFENFSLSLDID